MIVELILGFTGKNKVYRALPDWKNERLNQERARLWERK
jgi:hypothetical protein